MAEALGSVSSHLSLYKISSSKILRFNVDTSEVINEEIKIISISCKSVKDVLELLELFNCKNFPNAFVISIEIENDNLSLIDRWIKRQKDPIDQVKDKIAQKYSITRPLLLQINSRNFVRKNENIDEIMLNLGEAEIQKSFNDSKFTTEIFLNIQQDLNISDVDFAKFLNYDKNEHKIFLHTIRSGDDCCLRLLQLFDLYLTQEVRDEIFLAVIRSKNFQIFLAFFEVYEQSQIKSEKVEKILKIEREENFHNFFMVAVEYQNLDIVNFFLKICESFLSFELLKKASELSASKNFTDITRVLQAPLDRKIKEEVEKLHRNIESGNLKGVEEFSQKLKDERLCFNGQNVCALEHAINCRQFKIFSFLRANNFYTESGSELKTKIENLNDDQKNEIRVSNLKYNKEFPNAFIGVLLSKCKFDACSPVSSNFVRKMLTDLSRVDKLRPLLEIASQARIEIIFDFATESVKTMVPEYDEHTMGVAFFREGKLYVGRDRDRHSRTATFMHELTHMVLYLIYENGCLPYCLGDDQREREWAQITQAESENYEINWETVEPIIRWVFQCYSPGYEQLAELAVRPNHIMARYIDNPEIIQELREAHVDLFNFFNDKVLPDLKVPNILRLIKLNNDFGVIEKIENSTLTLKLSDSLEILKASTRKLILTSNVPKLVLSKLFNDIKKCSPNPLDIKVKNIFVDVEKTFDEELFDLLKNSEVDRVIIDLIDRENLERTLTLLELFPEDIQIILICAETCSNKFKGEKSQKFFTFDDLSEESKESVSSVMIKFQGKEVEVIKICDPIFDEIFSLLCNAKEISLNSVKVQRNLENFIPRMLLDSSGNEFEFETFLDSIQQERVVLISNSAGSGKTTLLKKIHESFLAKFPTHWISFVSLIDHVDELLNDDVDIEDDDEKFKFKNKKDVETIDNFKHENSLKRKTVSFEEKLIKILKLNKIEERIFIQKFSKGEVKIFFDGFDEISPKCKNQTLKLFKKFKIQNQNQIFITTRVHLEQDLKEKLEVESFEIKILTNEDQIKFLCDFWKNSHDDESFIKECAQQLTKKISEIVKDHQNLIGIPLIIQSVAKLFTNEIDGNFLNKLKILKFSDVFKKVIEQSLVVLAERFPYKLIENSLKRSSIFQALEHLTIVSYFDEEFSTSLGLSINDFEKMWDLEEVARSGVLTYDANKKVKFNHETYGQHFLSTIMENILITVLSLSDPQIELLQRILTDERFQIARMFLNEKFEEIMRKNSKLFSNEKSLRNSEISFFEKFTQSLGGTSLEKVLLHKNKKNETILHLSVEYGNFDTFQNVLETIQKNLKSVIQKELLHIKNEKGQNVLMISTDKNSNAFKNLLVLALDLMEKCEIEQLLRTTDQDGDNILHLAARDLKSKEIFEFLWLKIFEYLEGEEENLKDYLKVKGWGGRNILLRSIAKANENSFFFIVEKFFDFKDFIYENEDDGENFLHFLARFGSVAMLDFAFKKLEEKLSEEELKSILMVKSEKNQLNLVHCAAISNKNLDAIKLLIENIRIILGSDELKEMLVNEKDKDGNNVLHNAAAFTESKEVLEFFWLRIFEHFKEQEEENLKSFLKLKGWGGRNILLRSIGKANENSYYFIFENIFEKFFDLKDFIYENDEDGENFLHFLARFGSVSMLDFVFKKLEEKLSKEEFKSLLMAKGEKKQSNLLHCAAIQNQNLDAIKLLIESIRTTLGSDECKEMLVNEKDKDGNNVLHNAAAFTESKEVLEFFWLRIFEHFKEQEEENLKSFLKLKGWGGRNILLRSIGKANENSYYFIFENIFEKFFDLKDFIYENDEDGENFLHFLARFGSVSMLDFAFKKLEEKLSEEELKSILMVKSEKKQSNLLHCAVIENQNLDAIKLLIENIRTTLGSDELKEMLVNEKDKDGDNVLHNAAGFAESKEVFEFLWLIIFEHFKAEEENLKSFLKLKGWGGRNILLGSIGKANENSYFFIFENIFEKFFDFKDFIYEYDEDGENFLHFLARFGSVSMLDFTLKKLEEKLSEEMFKNLLIEKSANLLHCAAMSNQNLDAIKLLIEKLRTTFRSDELKEMLVNEKDKDGNNVLHNAAAFAKSREVFEFLWLRIFEFLKGEEENLKTYLKLKGGYGRNILLRSIGKANENSYYFIFENIFENFFGLKDFIYEYDEKGENFLLKLARFGSVSMLDFAFKKLEEKLSEEELKSILMVKSEKYQLNLLHCAVIENQNLNAIKLLIESIRTTLGIDELKKMLVNEKDKDGNNVLHNAAEYAESNEVFEFLWLKFFEFFKAEEENLKVFLKLKGWGGRNILLRSIGKANENSYYFIFQNIFENFFDLKDFIYEYDEKGENFLHFLARFGSVSMLDFALKKLKEKLSKEELNRFTTMKSEKEQATILHYAFYSNKNLDAIKMFVTFVEKKIGKDEFVQMLNTADIDKEFPVHCAIKNNNLETFVFVANVYEENFSKREIKNIFDSLNFIELVCENENEFVKEKVIEYYNNELCETNLDLK